MHSDLFFARLYKKPMDFRMDFLAYLTLSDPLAVLASITSKYLS